MDLSERLAATPSQEESKAAIGKKGKKGGDSKQLFQKAIVELNKEQYLVATLNADRSQVGACLLHSLAAESYSAY